MSKRQEIREQHHDEMIRNRILVLGLVTVGILLIVLALIRPGIKTTRNHADATNQTIAVTPITTWAITVNVDGQHLGDPNAPVKVDVWEDFQCSSCRIYSVNVEPKIISNYVEAGRFITPIISTRSWMAVTLAENHIRQPMQPCVPWIKAVFGSITIS